MVSTRYELQVGPFLPPGDYQLQLSLVDPRAEAGDLCRECLTIGTVQVNSLPRAFEAAPAFLSGAAFGDGIRLLGYDLAQADGDAVLTLYWQAMQRMDESYKVFVHLFDPATGAIVAQNDAVPRGWTYPTTWWEEGEVVSDEIVLSLQDAPAGPYQLAVGVYRQEGGERLPVIDAAGEQQPDGRLVLAQEIGR